MTTVTDKRYAAREYWERRLSERWGLHGVGHFTYGQPYNEWLYRVRKRVFLRHVRTLPIGLSDAAVLDIGSGTGFWLDVWHCLGVKTVVGSDMTVVAVKKLRDRHPDLEVLALDISEDDAVRTTGKRFDLISAFDVLFHIMEQDRFENAISNIATLMRPGGYFLFTDTFLHGKSVRSNHQVSRSLEEITRLLGANNLEVVVRAPMFVLMGMPTDTSSRVPEFLWKVGMAPVRFVSFIGHAYGAALLPLELLLTMLLRESPSTEIMICRKSVGKS
jgi:2-polyprenyl-3-methyl-5-hydroxy-6-metoxy-1,4-benzoquinol methylase